MLDLSQIVSDIHDMGRVTRGRTERAADQLRAALEVAARGDSDWEGLRAEIEGRGELPWLVAGFGDEPIGATFPLPEMPPGPYTVVATDGSQIALDRHAAAQCYLLNTGYIVIHYGTGERPTLSSRAQLFYKDEDIFPADSDGASDSELELTIETRRTLMESEAMTALIVGNAGRRVCAMVDNPLIVWTERGQTDNAIKALVSEFCKMLSAGSEHGVPVLGYVSAPGHKDVVGALRSTLCKPGCSHGNSDPCAPLSRLTDAELFAHLLREPGQRSALFHSQARSAKQYPDEHKIWFFYLNAGHEIARIEVPVWMTQNPALLDQAHALCCDQIVKGQGYPVALAEAHNQAIVRGPERAAFFALIEQSFAQQRIPVRQTRKAFAKRTPFV